MTIIILSVMTVYCFAALLILWWAISTTRRQRNDDLRYHRNLLLERTSTPNSLSRKAGSPTV